MESCYLQKRMTISLSDYPVILNWSICGLDPRSGERDVAGGGGRCRIALEATGLRGDDRDGQLVPVG